MKKRIVVLGAGLVGGTIARDLARQYAVAAADANPARLQALSAGGQVEGIRADLSDPEQLREVIREVDLVVNALPGAIGTGALKSIIANGRNVVDIAFSPENPLELDNAAKARGITAVVDCGVAPGLSNMILGYCNATLPQVTSFECLVGGLPAVREWPWEYKAGFSPADVIEEYTRPARYVENGHLVTRPALSDPELVFFPGIGTLEAFNTDGLRTLIWTMPVPDMKEKTLRYPGHARLMQILRDAGFFSTVPVEVGGMPVPPLAFTSRILFPSWQMKEQDEDFTVMRVVVRGQRDGQPVEIRHQLLDRFDPQTGETSMARTTGYTCTAVARLLLEGQFQRKGVCPPEYIGADAACFKRVLTFLEERGICLQVNETTDGGGQATGAAK